MPVRKRHPIEVVSRRTGLSKDLLRAWERRYGAVEPGRTESGRRLYSDEDIERLLLLRSATAAGRRIKSVVGLGPAELESLVREDKDARKQAAGRSGLKGDDAAAGLIAASIAAIEGLDDFGLRLVLDRAAATMGTEMFAIRLAAPLLQEVGERWHAGRLSPRHEHLASATLRGVLTRLVGVGPPASDAPGLVVSTPVGQNHEFGALLIAAIAAARGWRVTYLGANLPAIDIAETASATAARAVALSLVYPSDDPALSVELRALREALPAGTALLLGGRSASDYAGEFDTSEARLLGDLTAFRDALDELVPYSESAAAGRAPA